MGGWRWNKKSTVEDSRQFYLTAEQWRKFMQYPEGYLWTMRWFLGERETGSVGYYKVFDGRALRLVYTTRDRQTGEKLDMDYLIHIDATPCHYGGQRYWFICPLTKNGVPCRRRVGKLYFEDKWAGCWHCYDLTYESCQRSDARVRLFKKYPMLLALALKRKNPGFPAIRAALDKLL